MSLGVIPNPAGVYGQDPTAHPLTRWAVNKSGGSLRTGDIVIFNNAALTQITTTTTADNKRVLGVVGQSAGSDAGVSTETFAADVNTPVICLGPARVNIGSNTVAAGAAVASSTTAKVGIAPATPVAGSIVAIASEADTAKDANNTIRCFVKLA